MISMGTKQEIIIKYYREGKSKRKIAEELQIHRRTVKRYIDLYERARAGLADEAEVGAGFIRDLVSVPKYDSSGRGKRKLTQQISLLIKEYLQQNGAKRRQGLHKQVMKKIDIWEALRLAGHDIGYTTVCNYIRHQEQQGQSAYIKQVYEPGQDCEFDWAEVRLNLGGKHQRLMLAIFTAAMSNYRWAKLFWRQDTSSFQQAHADFFAAVQGVFQRMVYDNMRVAIKRFTGPNERELTTSFLQLSAYYQFQWRFCNVGQGNEKGHVERSVEYVRRKAFSRRDEFESLERANAYLEQICQQLNQRPLQGKSQSPQVLFEQERVRLYACPVAFDCAEVLELRVDKYATICSGTNHYSVPDHLVGQRVEVRLYPTHIQVYWQKRKQCDHERRRGTHGWYIKLEHYLDTLLKKPGALAGSMALKSADKRLRALFEQHFRHRPKVFIELLHYQHQKALSLATIEQAIQTCLRLCPGQAPSLDKIKILSTQQVDRQQPTESTRENRIEQASHAQLHELAHLLSNPS